MASPTFKNFGNSLVVRKADYRMSGTFTDANYLLNAFGDDMRTTSLGVIAAWNQWQNVATPILSMTELKKNVIYTKTDEGRLTFDMPYQLEGATIRQDLTADIEKPGIDQQIFEIVLGDGSMNALFAVGDRITADFRDGQQLIVVSVENAVGAGFKYKVQLVTNDRSQYFNKKWLAPTTQFFKISGTVGEFTEHFGGVNAGFGLMKLEHQLGGRRGVEYSITGQANRLNLKYGAGSTSLVDFLGGNSNLLSPNDPGFYMVLGEGVKDKKGNFVLGKDGQPRILDGTQYWLTMIDAMIMQQLLKDEERDLMWADGGVVTGARNKQQIVGEGLYKQMRRGNWATMPEYSRDRIINVFGQVFRNRTDIADKDRYFKVQGGYGAMLQYQRIFAQELQRYASQFGFILNGSDLGIVSGDAMNLTVGAYFNKAFLPGFGWLEFEHNPSFDAEYSRAEDGERINGLSKHSYTSCIFDVTDGKYTNAAKVTSNIEWAKGVDNGANVYLVRNESMPGIAVNYVAGRNSAYAPTMGRGKSVTSRAEQTTIMMENSSNVFLKDPSRSILFELR